MKKKHLIDVNNLTLSQIDNLFLRAQYYLESPYGELLKNKKLINLFFENSTRTRSSFEIAAKNMSAAVINIDISRSSLQKGESEQDTILTLNAMDADFITIRHNNSGAVEHLAQYSDKAIINSGDGAHAHPTQALLDCFTIYKAKKMQNLADFRKLKIAICGDIINSRVARSNIKLLTMLGSEINLVAPNTLLPKYFKQENISLYNNLKEGLRDCQIIYSLRIQKERMRSCLIPSNKEYFKLYGITNESLKYAANNCLILHPGPINRNTEISSRLADNQDKCQILNQVKNGIAIRQAILEFLIII